MAGAPALYQPPPPPAAVATTVQLQGVAQLPAATKGVDNAGSNLRVVDQIAGGAVQLVTLDTAVQIFPSGGLVAEFANNHITLNAPTAAAATAGAAVLPANPVGFLQITIGVTVFKIPYYNV